MQRLRSGEKEGVEEGKEREWSSEGRGKTFVVCHEKRDLW